MISKNMTAFVHGADGARGGIIVELSYDGGRDPLVVQLAFRDGSYEVIWLISRDLLLQAMDGNQLVGLSDVKARSGYHETGAVVYVHLATPDGAAVLRFERPALGDFLADTVKAVPTGGEGVIEHLNAFLASLPDTVEEFNAQMREAEDRAREEESE